MAAAGVTVDSVTGASVTVLSAPRRLVVPSLSSNFGESLKRFPGVNGRAGNCGNCRGGNGRAGNGRAGNGGAFFEGNGGIGVCFGAQCAGSSSVQCKCTEVMSKYQRAYVTCN
jgi:hypothetical protein